MAELPIFELPLVLLPGELVPLHIFEERYKLMIERSLEHQEPFGVVLRDDDGARSVGCTARIAELVERFDDGRLNIVGIGEEPFRVLDRHQGLDWPAGEVEILGDDDLAAIDAEAAAAARAAFADLAEQATGARPDQAEIAEIGAYGLAARVELPADTKQRLLESRDEDERMRLLANALKALCAAVKRGEIAADRGRSNGRVVFGQA